MSPFVLRPLLSSLPPSSLAVIVPSARRLPSFLRAMALVPLGGRPLAAAAAPPPPPPPVPVDEYFECNMCGDMKPTGCFYWYPGGQKHRSQCTRCDYLWKQIHKELRRQGCTGFYYTFVKRDDILRRSLFDFFNTHFGPLSGVSIKNWAIAEMVIPANGGMPQPAPGGVGAAPGGIVGVPPQPAPGGFGGMPQQPAPGGGGGVVQAALGVHGGMPQRPAGPGNDGFGKRVCLRSVTKVRFNAGSVTSFTSRTDIF